MNCVYDAFEAYLHFKGQRVFPEDFRTYLLLKRISHGPDPQPTYGGIVPWMLYWMTFRSYRCVVQHSLWTKEHYLFAVDNEFQKVIVQETDYGEYVDQITLSPAIYLILDRQHAVFSETVPAGIPVMAIQIN